MNFDSTTYTGQWKSYDPTSHYSRKRYSLRNNIGRHSLTTRNIISDAARLHQLHKDTCEAFIYAADLDGMQFLKPHLLDYVMTRQIPKDAKLYIANLGSSSNKRLARTVAKILNAFTDKYEYDMDTTVYRCRLLIRAIRLFRCSQK